MLKYLSAHAKSQHTAYTNNTENFVVSNTGFDVPTVYRSLHVNEELTDDNKLITELRIPSLYCEHVRECDSEEALVAHLLSCDNASWRVFFCLDELIEQVGFCGHVFNYLPNDIANLGIKINLYKRHINTCRSAELSEAYLSSDHYKRVQLARRNVRVRELTRTLRGSKASGEQLSPDRSA